MLHVGEALIEYADFYDYSTSYPEGERDPEEEADLDRIDDDCFELVLPSGAKVGHRSLARYYRQSLNPERAVVLRKSNSGPVMDHYKRFGWTGLTQTEVRKKAKDLQFMRRLQQKQWMRLGTKANKLQTYWRDPNGMC
jgi:pre-60S factor REI1